MSSASSMAYQRRNVAAGLCKRCGSPRNHYAFHCDECQIKVRQYNRKVRGTVSSLRCKVLDDDAKRQAALHDAAPKLVALLARILPDYERLTTGGSPELAAERAKDIALGKRLLKRTGVER